MTVFEIIDEVIRNEDATDTGIVTNVPGDRGGWTRWGITAKTLGRWRKLGRDATEQEIRDLSRAEAVQIYYHMYVIAPGFDAVPGLRLRAQLVDFGVNSGPERAVRYLQIALGLPEHQRDGRLGPVTRSAILVYPEALVNNALVAARLKFVDEWTDSAQSQKKFEEGVESRALRFFIA